MFRKLKNAVLDRSIYWSFDRTGFLRHQREFVAGDLDVDLRGTRCLVTGANSGLGLATARGLAHRGATVHMLCRNRERGEAAREDIRSTALAAGRTSVDLRLDLVDMSDLHSVRSFCTSFDAPVDVLIHNAGLLPDQRRLSPQGLELTVATHVAGPWLMTRLLSRQFRHARIITVSSGGMYSKKLDVAKMLSTSGSYDGVAAYAMTKRAQVVLSESWASELPQHGFHAMHPGWAATSGVQTSLPGFFDRMQGRLRSAAEGADTALWLAVVSAAGGRLQGQLDSGEFWFDRELADTELLPWTKTRESERRKLWAWCETVTAQ